MTIYDYHLIMPQTSFKPVDRAEKLCQAITKAEQQGWELYKISDDVNNALFQAWMRKPKNSAGPTPPSARPVPPSAR